VKRGDFISINHLQHNVTMITVLCYLDIIVTV